MGMGTGIMVNVESVGRSICIVFISTFDSPTLSDLMAAEGLLEALVLPMASLRIEMIQESQPRVHLPPGHRWLIWWSYY